MKKEVKIEKGREEDKLTTFMKEFFDKVNEYNESNPENQVNIMVLSRDKKGGASFLIGDPDYLIMELYEVSVRHQGFRQFLRNIEE